MAVLFRGELSETEKKYLALIRERNNKKSNTPATDRMQLSLLAKQLFEEAQAKHAARVVANERAKADRAAQRTIDNAVVKAKARAAERVEQARQKVESNIASGSLRFKIEAIEREISALEARLRNTTKQSNRDRLEAVIQAHRRELANLTAQSLKEAQGK